MSTRGKPGKVSSGDKDVTKIMCSGVMGSGTTLAPKQHMSGKAERSTAYAFN